MAEAIFLCEKEFDNSPLIEGVRAIILNSDDGALVAATAVVTFGAVGTANDTITIGGQTYTLVAVPSNPNEVDIGGNASATADNLVAAINGGAGEGTAYGTGTVANAFVTAANASGAVTLTAIDQGPAGNGIEVSIDSTAITATVTALVGGSATLAGAATVTFADAMTADEVVQVGTQTYTFVASPSQANDIDIGGSATATAANFAAAINQGAGGGTAYGTGTVAHPDVSAVAVGAAVTLTNRQLGSDTAGFDAQGKLSPVRPVQLSTDGDVTFTDATDTFTAGGTYGDLGSEAAAACNRALSVSSFRADYFDRFTEIDDLSSGPLAADQSGYVISNNGVTFVAAP